MAPPLQVGTARTRDGDALSYRVEGELSRERTRLPLLCSNGIGVSTFFWDHLVASFSPSRAVVTWDYRGHGKSPLAARPEDQTVVQCAQDLWAVADALGLHEVVLVGHSMGCEVLLEAARLHPERCAALVPMLGAAGRVLESFLGLSGLTPIARVLIALGERAPHLFEQLMRTTLAAPGLWPLVKALGVVHPDLCPREEFDPYFAHLRSLDLRGYFALAKDLLTHDASDLLPQLALPVLVVAGENDLFTPLHRSQELAGLVPHAELLIVPQGSHAALVEQPELIALAVEKFLRRHGLAGESR